MDLPAARPALFIFVAYSFLSNIEANNNSSTTKAAISSNSGSMVQPTSLSYSGINMTTSATNLLSVVQTTMFSSTKDLTSSVQTTFITVTATSSSLSVQPTNSSGVSTFTTYKNENEDDHTALVIALATIAGIAALAAVVFCFLYLRNSPHNPCSGRLHFHRNPSETFPVETAGEIPISHIRSRIASLSSIRRQAICKSEPFSLLPFREHVKVLHADSDYLFSAEYEAVGNKKYLNDADKTLELSTNEGQKANNKAKNRYGDILPYDHCRVVLSEIEGDPDSVYINANYVDSYRKPRAYIAAQGPLATSLTDFWRMIWESDTRVIVMVTNLFERTKSKCVQYWPNKGSSIYGFLRVTFVKEESFANYVIRTLSVEPRPDQVHYIKVKSESESRVIQQFHFTEWPDHDVPVHPVAILKFVRQSKSSNPPDAGPLIVHCSAGVGRSGAYIVVDSMMERIEDEKNVDIFNFLNHIRTQRNFLVQEESQYTFVHDCILEYINFGDTNIPIREFHSRLKSLRTVNSDSKRSRIMEEFEDIDCTKSHEKHKWAGKKTFNLLKNRRKDVLPVERTRVKLPPVLGIEGADYINASFIDGFGKKREYIATQAPMVKTAESFYRMISSTKSSIIVMLLDDEQWQKDDYADLPTEDEPVTCGRFEIHLESQDVSEKFTVRKLRLFSSESSDGSTVTHYHYHDWPACGLPRDKISLINFIEQVREHKMAESPDNPVTVYCDCGVGATGVFCLVSSLYEQIEREQCVDVFHTAKLFCVQRPKLIETEAQYSFCYELLDQVITRKLISMTSDSGNEDDKGSHALGMNGAVVMGADSSHAGTESPKNSPDAGNKRPEVSQNADEVKRSADTGEDNISPRTTKASPDTSKSAPVSPILVTDSSPVEDKQNLGTTNNNSCSEARESPDTEPSSSDTEQPNTTTSSRQALILSSESFN